MYNRGFRIGATAALILLSGAGCSNLVVKKVPLDKRIAGTDDHLKGFRYYLNRPYLMVNDKILLKETKSLIVARKNGATGQMIGTFLDGPRRNQKINVGDSKKTQQTVAVSQVTPEELAKMKAVLVARNKFASASGHVGKTPTEGALHDESIVRTQHTEAAAPPPVQSPQLPAPSPPGTPPNGSPQATGQTANVSINVVGGAAFGGANASDTSFGAAAPAATTGTSLGAVDVTPIPIPGTGTPTTHSLVGNMQIVYLPDLDEQYVIKSKNTLAKSAFGLTFNDDSTLGAVEGNHDATTLTVSLLEQVDKAITAAQGVLGAEITQQSKSVPSTGKAPSLGSGAPNGPAASADVQYYQYIERCYIRPGLYRLNKPWEMGGDQAEMVGFGLLAKLGIPYVIETERIPAN